MRLSDIIVYFSPFIRQMIVYLVCRCRLYVHFPSMAREQASKHHSMLVRLAGSYRRTSATENPQIIACFIISVHARTAVISSKKGSPDIYLHQEARVTVAVGHAGDLEMQKLSQTGIHSPSITISVDCASVHTPISPPKHIATYGKLRRGQAFPPLGSLGIGDDMVPDFGCVYTSERAEIYMTSRFWLGFVFSVGWNQYFTV